MTAGQLLKGLSFIESTVEASTLVTGVVSDTRKIIPGACFVCIAGLRFDSHSAAADMMEQGASFVVVTRRLEGDFPQVVVEDSRAALSILWSNWYGNPEQSFRTVVGITGTNGKTSTSLILRHILQKAGCVCGLIGTTKYVVDKVEYDAPLTTPDPEALFGYFAQMREAGCDTLIMEVSSHSLSQRRVENIPFTVGIFTNLTQDHLDYHGTMENYRKEKEKLFSMCRVGLVNRDDAACDHFLESAKCKTYTYGMGNADFSAQDAVLSAEGVEYRLSYEHGELSAKIGIPGRFSVYNSCAGAACALLLGVDTGVIEEALRTMPGVDGRMQRQPDTCGVSVLIDYAHTPDALENVLTTLCDLPHGKIYTVFGCGGDRDPMKRPLMGEIACRYSNRVVITSDNPRTEDPEAIIRDILKGCEGKESLWRVVVDRTEAIHTALSAAEAGDVVLLAGKGHEEYVIDKDGKHPYSERAIVRAYYQNRRENEQ